MEDLEESPFVEADMNQRLSEGNDLTLLMLVALANKADVAISVTLLVGGAVVTGDLISHQSWQARQAEGIRGSRGEAPPEIREAIADSLFGAPAPDKLTLPRFVHLQEARITAGSETAERPTWRGWLSSVDGWSLGR